MLQRGRLLVVACVAVLAGACGARPGAAGGASSPSKGALPAHAEALGIACDAGDAPSCARLGNVYLRGEAVARDFARAEAFYAKACGLGLGSSCANWGVLVFKRSPTDAYALYAKACALGNEGGCYNEGHALATGEGAAKDLERAAKLFVGACEHGQPSACSMAGRAYSMGEGVPKDDAKAAVYLARACEGDASRFAQWDGSPLPAMGESCAAAAKLLEPSATTDKDKRRVATMLERACTWGYDLACNDAGTDFIALGTEDAKTHGMQLVAGGCDKGDPTACANMGTLLLTTDPFGAVPYLRKACDGKNGQACANLGFLYSKGSGVLLDLAKAVQLFGVACDLDNYLGCLFAGGAYYEGNGVKEDRARARVLLEKACDGAVGNACAALARMYEYALGVDEDTKRARAYRRRACDAGVTDACEATSAVTTRPAAK
jgi:uncharacterized protein